MYFVPLELVREIIASVFDDTSSCEEHGRTSKPLWSSIEPLTVASKAYRALVFEYWFRTFFVSSSDDLSSMQNLLREIRSGWTREIHCVQLASSDPQVWELCGFQRLTKIRLDWLSKAMVPHYGSADPADRLPFTHVPSTVTELDVRGLPWPSPLIFHNIGMILPSLQILRLRQQKIWCGLCHTCSVARFLPPGPEKIIYEDGLGLPMHYARSFSSLLHLHSVYITIPDFGLGLTTLSDDKGQNQYLWAGECDRCMGIMYDDEAFRDHWVARKQGIRFEGRASEVVYVRPPALRRVEWRFWKTDENEDSDEMDSENESFDSGSN